MPVPCPDCSRPNHERRTECLYCGAELPPPVAPAADAEPVAPDAPEAAATPAPSAAELLTLGGGLVAPVVPSELRPRWRWTLVLDPWVRDFEDDGSSILHDLAAALETDPYQARKLLNTPYPKVLLRNDERAPLAEIGAALGRLGLATTVLGPDDYESLGEPFEASSLSLPPELASGDETVGPVTFQAEGRSEVVAPGEVMLLVVGELKVDRLGPDREVSWRSALPGAAPGRDALDLVRSDYPVLEIQRARVPRIRVHLPRFDFSGLGSLVGPSALLNLKALQDLLMAASPGADLDRSFRVLPAELEGGPGVVGGYVTNEPQFDRYARTVGLHRSRIADVAPVPGGGETGDEA